MAYSRDENSSSPNRVKDSITSGAGHGGVGDGVDQHLHRNRAFARLSRLMPMP